jgi:hypothetical protein
VNRYSRPIALAVAATTAAALFIGAAGAEGAKQRIIEVIYANWPRLVTPPGRVVAAAPGIKTPNATHRIPLSQVAVAIPHPLPPASRDQSCSRGATITIRFASGRKIVYGPCTWPNSIQPLYQELFFALNHGGRLK